MAGSERRQGIEAALLAVLALAFAELGSGCITIVSLEDKPCPCASGYTCCATTQTCMTQTQICPAAPASGGASGAGTAGQPSAGGTNSSSGGEAGGGGETGAGGEPGPPQWRPVGADEDGLLPTNRVNMAIAPDGTPYVAFRGCDVCAPPAHTPYVKRYEGGAWELLPTIGLPQADVMSPSLQFDQVGTLYVLIDSGVYAFDGEAWVQILPNSPYSFTEDASLWRDEQGTFYTTQYIAEIGEISVVRSVGSSWQALGSSMLSKTHGATVRVFDGDVYLANASVTDDFIEFVTLRRFDGTDWQVLEEFGGSAIEFAVVSPQTLYFSYAEPGGGVSARLVRRDGGAWTDLGMVPSWFYAPKFVLTSAGTPYMVYLAEDFVNVNVLEGSTWIDVDSRDLGNSSMLPALVLDERDGAVVPYVASSAGDVVRVRKYE